MRLFTGLLILNCAASAAAADISLFKGTTQSLPMAPSETHQARLPMQQGQSAEVIVLQQGIDVVVDLIDPSGKRIDQVDSPNGRQGDEPVRWLAERPGVHVLRIQPIAPNEPTGRITISVAALRSAAETRRILSDQRSVRNAAAQWLARSSDPLPADVNREWTSPRFDALARSARVVGLGEPSHGSREINDLRLAMIKQLVEKHGYRLIGLEDSSVRWRVLEPFVSGRAQAAAAPTEWGWIGRRTRSQLLSWVRHWNLGHPTDQVQVVGLDPQDSAISLQQLSDFIGAAYEEPGLTAWAPHKRELTEADEQTHVFGNSTVAEGTRQFLAQLLQRFDMDRPLLVRRHGAEAVEKARASAQELFAFADFNGQGGVFARNRDEHMAASLLAKIDKYPKVKAIYWGHNSHVSAASTRWGPTGAVLRSALGCDYRAIATTFGTGGVLAQIPNDETDRLVVSNLGEPGIFYETTESMLEDVRKGVHFSSWDCNIPVELVPGWLREPRLMRWVGGLYSPDTPASGAYRAYSLLRAFDAIAYVPEVTAESAPNDRPLIPARRQRP